MTPINRKVRLPLGAAMRRYWPFLLGITAFHVLVVFVPGVSENRNLVFVLFFAAILPSMYPYAFGSAPFSFEAIAGVYWFFGFILTAALRAVLYYILGWGP